MPSLCCVSARPGFQQHARESSGNARFQRIIWFVFGWSGLASFCFVCAFVVLFVCVCVFSNCFVSFALFLVLTRASSQTQFWLCVCLAKAFSILQTQFRTCVCLALFVLVSSFASGHWTFWSVCPSVGECPHPPPQVAEMEENLWYAAQDPTICGPIALRIWCKCLCVRCQWTFYIPTNLWVAMGRLGSGSRMGTVRGGALGWALGAPGWFLFWKIAPVPNGMLKFYFNVGFIVCLKVGINTARTLTTWSCAGKGAIRRDAFR